MRLLLTDLPLEILLYIVSLTGRDLCSVSRLFMSLYNDFYKHRTLNIISSEDSRWTVLHIPLEQTISNLDIFRRPIRKLLYNNGINQTDSDGAQNPRQSQPLLDEYIIDSWYIVYSLLESFPFVKNNNIFDEVQEDEPIMHSTCFCFPQTNLLKEPRIPLNIWLSISDTSYLYPIRNIITNVLSVYNMQRNEEYSPLAQICDWIKEPGVYCIRLGTIETSYMNSVTSATDEHFLSMKLVASLTGGYDWNKASSIKLLGYNFDPYVTQLKQPWLFFRLDLEYEPLFYVNNDIPNINYLLSSHSNRNNPYLTDATHKKLRKEILQHPPELPEVQTNFKIPVQVVTTYKGRTNRSEDEVPSISDPRVPRILR